MTELIRYEQARTALAECHRIDDAKDIADKAQALHSYAHAGAPFRGPGCYVFVRDEEVLYVGESRNVVGRLSNHPWHHLLKEGATVQCFPCRNHRQVERWLIEGLLPTLNGKTPSAREMERNAAARISASGTSAAERIEAIATELFGGLFPERS